MTTYEAVPVAAASAVFNGREPANWTGEVHVGQRVLLNRTDNPAQVFVPDARRIEVFTAALAGFFSDLSGSAWTALRALVNNAPVGFAVMYSGSAWTARRVFVFSSYLASDKQTLVGQLFERLPDNSEVLLPNVRLHFEGTNLAQAYGASKSDIAGGYIAILETGVDYTIAGSNELACKVYEIVEVRPFSNHTDIVLRVPEECRIPEVVIMPGEPIHDVLNREAGFHDYEPVKSATASRPDKALNVKGSQANVAAGAEVAVVDFVADSVLQVTGLPFSADGDAEFYFVIGDSLLPPHAVPRRRLNVDVPQDDLLPGGGSPLYVNAGQRVRVMGKNTGDGPALLEASVIGKKT